MNHSKTSLLKRLTRNSRKLIVLPGYLLSTTPMLMLLGFFNRLLGRPLKAVFIGYPANYRYIAGYCLKSMIPHVKTRPFLGGYYKQGNAAGLIMFISAMEREFSSDLLISLRVKSQMIARLLGCERVVYAGILPSAMQKHDIMTDDELEGRGKIIVDVIMKSISRVSLDILPVIVLGGKGSVGSQLCARLEQQGFEVYPVDRGDALPAALFGKRALLIDCARKGVLRLYWEQLWPGLTILNETYPEPDPLFVETLRDKNINVYHIVGVKATICPPLPGAYRGAVPCCGMLNTDQLEVELKLL